jgi:hypothetical protein
VTKSDQLYMVFDVESIGLHGEGFAVGYVVVNKAGDVFCSARYACHPSMAQGDDEGRAWVAENCPLSLADCDEPSLVRFRFWQDWLTWKERGAVLVADCAWPVEARFLIGCVDDDATRTWEGPYPLHELASFMVAAGMDPMAENPRLPDEPQHDPLGDARHSARRLLRALASLAAADPAPSAGTTEAP